MCLFVIRCSLEFGMFFAQQVCVFYSRLFDANLKANLQKGIECPHFPFSKTTQSSVLFSLNSTVLHKIEQATPPCEGPKVSR